MRGCGRRRRTGAFVVDNGIWEWGGVRYWGVWREGKKGETALEMSPPNFMFRGKILKSPPNRNLPILL